MNRYVSLIFIYSILFCSSSVLADTPMHDVLKVSENLYLFRLDHPKFGNPTTIVSIGNDGVLIVDPGPLDLVETLLERIEELGGKNVKYVTTTHHHGDHSEGLVFFSDEMGTVSTGSQVQLLKASRVLLDGRSLTPSQLPKLQFEDQLNLNMNDENIHLLPLPRRDGHTGGDLLVHFSQENILAVGDYVFLDDFPAIDVTNGGNIEGFIHNLEYILSRFSENTLIVPGHSTVRPEKFRMYSMEELAWYKDLIRESISYIHDALNGGETLESLMVKGLPNKFKSLSEPYLYVSEEGWIRLIYKYHYLNSESEKM